MAVEPRDAGPQPLSPDDIAQRVASAPIRGLDVSRYQGTIDWAQVRDAGVAFAYVKATESTTWRDPTFSRNWSHAKRAGVKRGAYHFFSLCTPGAKQAENFNEVVPGDAQALPAALDLELAGMCTRRPPAEDVLKEIDAFITAVENKTKKPVVFYVGGDFELEYPTTQWSSRPRWVRVTPGMVLPETPWAVWQYSGNGRCAGVVGDVDLNVFHGDALEFSAFAARTLPDGGTPTH